MGAEGHLPREGDTGGTTEEAELAQVLESYLAQLEAGRPADPERLITAHPELARPLRACLKVMHLAQGLDQSGELPIGPLPVDPGIFGAVPALGSSALTVLWPGEDGPPRVLLPEPPEEDSEIVRTHCDDLLALLGGAAGRYQVLGEIARGGMGMVLKARDADLGRDLALKVLLDRHRGDQDVIRRFVEEAQIGGQLQHPGIVPVHELGTLADLRPFFTMKLVKGRTLAALLAERNLFDRAKHPHANAGVVTRGNAVVGVVPPRPFRGEGARRAGEGAGVDAQQEQEALKRHENLPQADFSSPHPNPPPPRGEGIRNSSPLVGEDTRGGAGTASDLPRFLSIFEAVCQTMAYAHARRVIHRDLKPANVMVGAFGEVQVMDWGLAKVLAEGVVADEERASRQNQP
ncbi:MAG: protein kinase domain-containing protein, partial [Isosphaeraceae bacterium]